MYSNTACGSCTVCVSSTGCVFILIQHLGLIQYVQYSVNDLSADTTDISADMPCVSDKILPERIRTECNWFVFAIHNYS